MNRLKEIIRQNPDIRSEYLKVSEGGVYLVPTMVQTVLGSCLGGVFYAPSKGIGAIFHAFLPYRADYEANGGNSVYRYVDTAIEHVVGQFARLGVKPAQLNVSLVGGANGLVDERGGVGLKNVDAAYQMLEKYRLRAAFTDVGGEKGRKVLFLSSTGQLKVTKLKGLAAK
jgi:chemotaxis protein CheD